MKRLFFASLAALASPLVAQYAPIPESEQGFPLVVSVRSEIGYDDNIFGSSAGERESAFFRVTPSADLNWSITDQTFWQGRYSIGASYFEDRPSDELLVDHRLSTTFSHLFTNRTSFRVTGAFYSIDSPEAEQDGIPDTDTFIGGQTNQSYILTSIAPSITHQLSPLFSLSGSYSGSFIRYDDDDLARALDVNRNTVSGSLSYIVNPRLSAVGELRYGRTSYVNDPENSSRQSPDRESFYYLGGLDFDLSEVNQISFRAGVEQRNIDNPVIGADDIEETDPFAEVSTNFSYAPRASITGTVRYQSQTTSNPELYPDQQSFVTRARLQQPLGRVLTLGVGLSQIYYVLEPTEGLGYLDITEREYRAGVSLTWNPNDNWSFIAEYNYTNRESEVDEEGTPAEEILTENFSANRERERSILTISARYSFGVDF